jgi:hypothetical protein
MKISYTSSGSKIGGKVVQKKSAPGSGYNYTIEW